MSDDGSVTSLQDIARAIYALQEALGDYTGILPPNKGGTGVANNSSSTITISGAYGLTLTLANTTSITLPTSGTLATLAGAEELTNKTLTSSVGKGTWTASGTWTLPALTLGGAITYGGVTLSNAVTGTGNMVLSASPTITGHATIEGVTATGATGTGKFVFDTAPTFATSITTPSVLATANDSGALGASGTAFADLFLASGGVINWNAGNYTLTHSASVLTASGTFLVGSVVAAQGLLAVKQSNSSNGLSVQALATDSNILFYHDGTNGNIEPTFALTGAYASLDLRISGGSALLLSVTTRTATLSSLAGTGSRAVMADANGLLSAPVSDENFKENWSELDGLAIARNLKMGWFDWKKEYQPRYGNSRQIGITAQSAFAAGGWALGGEEKGGSCYANYDKLGVVALAAIRQLDARLNAAGIV